MRQQTPKRALQLAAVSVFAMLACWFSWAGQSRAANQTYGLVVHGQTLNTAVEPNRTVPDGHYVGNQACGQCHADIVKSQKSTPMGLALYFSKDSRILHDNPHLVFHEGQYTYNIDTKGGHTVFSVSDGKITISEPVTWAFGKGLAGQTYVFQHNGRYIEGRVSYYTGVKNLDITVGHPTSLPRSIEDAIGRPMGADETLACFGCHTSRAATPAKLEVDHVVPGVTCESCHGPGEKHIAAIKSGKVDEAGIYNPGTLATEDVLNFCGACHRTWEQVGLLGLRGVNNVRFQPYRLTNSKCYDADDRRISCIACHDPHEDLKHDAAFYDSKCTACHTTDPTASKSGNRVARICPVGKQDCAGCHMPKYDLPGGHYKFSDHDIRIVRQGDPYPN